MCLGITPGFNLYGTECSGGDETEQQVLLVAILIPRCDPNTIPHIP